MMQLVHPNAAKRYQKVLLIHSILKNSLGIQRIYKINYTVFSFIFFSF